jgi:hypothetical protein
MKRKDREAVNKLSEPAALVFVTSQLVVRSPLSEHSVSLRPLRYKKHSIDSPTQHQSGDRSDEQGGHRPLGLEIIGGCEETHT